MKLTVKEAMEKLNSIKEAIVDVTMDSHGNTYIIDLLNEYRDLILESTVDI